MTGHKPVQSIMFTTGVYTSWSGYLEWNHVTGVTKTWKWNGTKNGMKRESMQQGEIYMTCKREIGF